MTARNTPNHSNPASRESAASAARSALTSDSWDVSHIRHTFGRRPAISRWGRVYGGLSLVFWSLISGGFLAAVGAVVSLRAGSPVAEAQWHLPNWLWVLTAANEQAAAVVLVALLLGTVVVVGLFLAAAAPDPRLRGLAGGAATASAVSLVFAAALPVVVALLTTYLLTLARVLGRPVLRRAAGGLLVGLLMLAVAAALAVSSGWPLAAAAAWGLAAIWTLGLLATLNAARHAVPGL